MPTTDDGDIRNEVKSEKYSSINQNKYNVSDVVATYTQKPLKTKLCSSSIATVVAKHLNSASNNKLSQKPLHVLFDSGSDGSFINQKWTVFGKNSKIVKPTTWITGAGAIKTKRECNLKFKLDEFSTSKEVSWNFHVDETEMSKDSLGYDMIIGLDLLCELGLIINCEEKVVEWQDLKIPMTTPVTKFKNKKQLRAVLESTQEPESTKSERSRLVKILDADYKPADIDDIVMKADNLNKEQKDSLRILLNKYKNLFDGSLGDFNVPPIKLEVKPNTEPVHSRPFPVPHIHRQTLYKEIQRMVALGILEKASCSAWASPTFIIPKPNGTVRMVSDFRKLNTNLVRKPYPIPKISGIMQELEGFQHATALDLNMGYYTIRLDPGSQDMCTIITPWGKYKYLRLPMGIMCAPDIFQEKMSNLMEGLEFARTYLDDLLCLSKGNFDEHLKDVETVLIRLQKANLKVNASKSSFGKTEIDYLGYVVTRNGIKPQPKKIEAILKIARPSTVKDVRSFLGMVQYYRDIWQKRSHILAPLTELTGGKKKKKFEWNESCEKAFVTTKELLAKDVMLAYPNFSKKFVIHTDASDLQLGSVISQENRPIAFYSRKLNSAQRRYTTTEKELLSIVETLKEFKTILLGYEIEIHTDHKNLVHETLLMSSDRVMRWRLIIEEYGPKIFYIPGPNNVVADALSRLPTMDETPIINKKYARTVDINDECPVDAGVLATAQRNELRVRTSELKRKVREDKDYLRTMYDTHEIILYKNKIYVPQPLRERMLNWYHHYLSHPGATRLAKTVQQSCDWPGLVADCVKLVSKCATCKKFKKTNKPKYGKLPVKTAEVTPWAEVHVDLIGPYTVKTQRLDTKGVPITLTLTAMTFIDPSTGWFEIAEVPSTDKSSARISQLFNQTWLNRYPRPQKVRFDNGSEFKKDFIPLLKDFGVKPKPTSIKNPQSNAIVERVHQVVGDMLRTHDLNEYDFDEIDPWGPILQDVAYAIRATHHTTTKASPCQLVFGRDMLFNIPYTPNWENITAQKQKEIIKNNNSENKRRVDHDYAVNDNVLIYKDGIFRKLDRPFLGPFKIIQIYTNGTVRIQRGIVDERINIRRLTPYTTDE